MGGSQFGKMGIHFKVSRITVTTIFESPLLLGWELLSRPLA